MAEAANFGKSRSNLNLERLKSMRQSAGRVQGDIQRTAESVQKARRAFQEKRFGDAYSEMENSANYLGDSYSDNKSSLNAARMRSGAMPEASSAAKVAQYAAGGREVKAAVEATKLAFSLRKKIAAHDNSAFIVLVGIALLSDFLDLSLVLGLLFKGILLIALWGKGGWKVKLIGRVILFFDCIPPICWLPLTTISVIYVWWKCVQEVREHKKSLDKLREQSPGMEEGLEGEYA